MKNKLPPLLTLGLTFSLYACCVTDMKQAEAELEPTPVVVIEPLVNPLYPCVSSILYVTANAVGDPCATTEGVISDIGTFDQGRYERSLGFLSRRGPTAVAH